MYGFLSLQRFDSKAIPRGFFPEANRPIKLREFWDLVNGHGGKIQVFCTLTFAPTSEIFHDLGWPTGVPSHPLLKKGVRNAWIFRIHF